MKPNKSVNALGCFDDDSFYRQFELHEDFNGEKPY